MTLWDCGHQGGLSVTELRNGPPRVTWCHDFSVSCFTLGWAISKTAILDHCAQPGQNEVTLAFLGSCCLHTLPPAVEVR